MGDDALLVLPVFAISLDETDVLVDGIAGARGLDGA
jgi:hypothetical protein